MLGIEKMVHAKQEEGEKIKVRHDKIKKFLCKPQVVIVCIV
jgi:carbon monoxide dehydrogenase subunit G